MDISRKQIFMALAKNVPAGGATLGANAAMTWAAVDSKLPKAKIEVLGPPSTTASCAGFRACSKSDLLKLGRNWILLADAGSKLTRQLPARNRTRSLNSDWEPGRGREGER